MQTQYSRMEEGAVAKSRNLTIVSAILYFLALIFTFAGINSSEWGFVKIDIYTGIDIQAKFGVWQTCLSANALSASASECITPFKDEQCNDLGVGSLGNIGNVIKIYCNKWKTEQAFSIAIVLSLVIALALSIVAIAREKNRYSAARFSGHFALIALFSYVILIAIWCNMAKSLKDFVGDVMTIINAILQPRLKYQIPFSAGYGYPFFLAIISMFFSGFGAIAAYY